MRLEAQAIVMAAGPGSRMSSVGFRAKCLLPIGNYPMIYYPLKFLEDSGFEEATIIVNQKEEREIKKLNEVYGLKLRLDLVAVDTSEDPGTAESLRAIENKIKKNIDEVVIISSDLITDASLIKMMNSHRSKKAALTILTANQNSEYTKATPPGPKSKSIMNKDVICNESGTDRLVYAVSAGDYDDFVTLPSRVMSSARAGIGIASDLLDAHLYIMKRWLLDFVLHKESPCASMGSLKAEVIPHLISEQFFKSSESSSGKCCVDKFAKADQFENLILKHNTSIEWTRLQRNSRLDARVSYAYHHHPGFCVRVNTMGSLWQINRKINDIYSLLKMRSHKFVKGQSDEISERAQICSESVIGRSTQVSEKTNLSSCVLGNHCRVNPMVRMSNSVLFDYVHVQQGCVIENSLICVNVDEKCVIRNCIVTDASKVAANKTFENELLEKGLSQEYSL